MAERIIGLAGIPDNLQDVFKVLNMIPDWLGGSALGIFLVLSWQRWGGRLKAVVRDVLGRARKLIRIGNAEYIPFDNLIDVVSAIDMKPLGDDGVRVGTLPAGTNLVCLPSGHMRLALPVRISGHLEIRSGKPRIEVTLAGGSAGPTAAKATEDE